MTVAKAARMITRHLNQYLTSKFDLTCFYGTNFSYYYLDNTVEFSLLNDADSWNFEHFCRKKAPDINADSFLYSLFHEIGHAETGDDISEMDANFSRDEKDRLTKELNLGKIDISVANKIYYNLPDEIAATEWALDYMRNNQKEVKELWDKIQPILMRLYEGVEM